jgi:hypothetical protein
MKQYPKELQEQYTMVVPDTVNLNPSLYLNESEGGLDGQNMPVDSLLHTHFVDPTTSTTTTANTITVFFKGQTQQYKSVERWNKDFAADEFTELLNYNLKTSDWSKGWNRLAELTDFDELILELDAEEGYLNGVAQINYRHGMQVVNEGGINYTVGEDWWTRWGIFINDVLVAESGNAYPRLENLVIPFSIPVGSQKLSIDLRWKSITTDALDVPGYTGSDPTTDLEIFGAEIWARNTYR